MQKMKKLIFERSQLGSSILSGQLKLFQDLSVPFFHAVQPDQGHC